MRVEVKPDTTLKDLQRQVKNIQDHKENLVITTEKKIESLRKELRGHPEMLDSLEELESRFESAKDTVTGPNSMIKALGRHLRAIEGDVQDLNIRFRKIPHGGDRANVWGGATIVNNIITNLENTRDDIDKLRQALPYLGGDVIKCL